MFSNYNTMSDFRSGNRFERVQHGQRFDQIMDLHLDQTLMPWEEVRLRYLIRT